MWHDNWHYKNDNCAQSGCYVTFGSLRVVRLPRCHSCLLTVSQVGAKGQIITDTADMRIQRAMLQIKCRNANEQVQTKLTPSLIMKVHQIPKKNRSVSRHIKSLQPLSSTSLRNLLIQHQIAQTRGDISGFREWCKYNKSENSWCARSLSCPE